MIVYLLNIFIIVFHFYSIFKTDNLMRNYHLIHLLNELFFIFYLIDVHIENQFKIDIPYLKDIIFSV